MTQVASSSAGTMAGAFWHVPNKVPYSWQTQSSRWQVHRTIKKTQSHKELRPVRECDVPKSTGNIATLSSALVKRMEELRK